MHVLERWCMALRHNPPLNRADWLWDHLRPHYDRMLARWARNGLERVINNSDRLRIRPQLRGITQCYEPAVWHHLMARIRRGDVVADVGAYVGLYTVALAKRVGPSGRVVAFEPDPENFAALQDHAFLNGVSDRVELLPAAVGAHDGAVPFATGGSSESHITLVPANHTCLVRCVCLDTVFADRRLDILKVDVEGYEEAVLKGGMRLLQDRGRCPRLVYIEVHPYAWPAVGTSSASLLDVLGQCHYRVASLEGQPVEQIRSYGEIVAEKRLYE